MNPKETLEQAAEKYSDDPGQRIDFYHGASWQSQQDADKKYSDSDIEEILLQNDTFRQKLFQVQEFCENQQEIDGRDVWGMIEVIWHER